MQAIIDTMKQIATEKINNGASASQVAEQIASEMGTDVARLIFADIALDNGNKEAAKGLVANVTK